MIPEEVRQKLLKTEELRTFEIELCTAGKLGRIKKGTDLDDELKKHYKTLREKRKEGYRKLGIGHFDEGIYDNFEIKRKMEEKRRLQEQQNKKN